MPKRFDKLLDGTIIVTFKIQMVSITSVNVRYGSFIEALSSSKIDGEHIQTLLKEYV